MCSYYLYQWPVTMTVIVVVSIFISLCTCTLVLWVRDVLRDFDVRRRTRTAALQRRQGGGGVVGSGTGVRVQTQLPGGAGGGTSVANAGVHRRPVVIPRPPHSGGSGGTPISGLPPYTPRGVGGGAGDERATPTPSELSESSGVGVEDVTTSSQIGELSCIIIFLPVDALLTGGGCPV